MNFEIMIRFLNGMIITLHNDPKCSEIGLSQEKLLALTSPFFPNPNLIFFVLRDVLYKGRSKSSKLYPEHFCCENTLPLLIKLVKLIQISVGVSSRCNG